jgi:hypothetical protein
VGGGRRAEGRKTYSWGDVEEEEGKKERRRKEGKGERKARPRVDVKLSTGSNTYFQCVCVTTHLFFA